MPRTRPGSLLQSPSASRPAYGAIAADNAWDDVRGTEPGMLVTQKCVTPSHWYVGASQEVGLVVSMQPPWSTLMSTMTLPASMLRTMSDDTTCGARAPVTSTAPMTTSAARTASATSETCGYRPVTFAPMARAATSLSRSLSNT